MSTRRALGTIQGPHTTHHGTQLFHKLQDQILKNKQFDCTIRITPSRISIRTKTWAEYYMAKAEIKGCVSLPIERDILGEIP